MSVVHAVQGLQHDQSLCGSNLPTSSANIRGNCFSRLSFDMPALIRCAVLDCVDRGVACLWLVDGIIVRVLNDVHANARLSP